MAGLTNAEFMVKGYHYTKPTDPIRSDAARLHIDTNVSGEESSVAADKWKVPTSATMENYSPEESRVEEGAVYWNAAPNQTYTYYFERELDNTKAIVIKRSGNGQTDTLTFNNGVTWSGTTLANEPYYSQFWNGNLGLGMFEITSKWMYMRFNTLSTTPIDITFEITYYPVEGVPKKIHFKGIHGFYAQY